MHYFDALIPDVVYNRYRSYRLFKRLLKIIKEAILLLRRHMDLETLCISFQDVVKAPNILWRRVSWARHWGLWTRNNVIIPLIMGGLRIMEFSFLLLVIFLIIR